MKTFSPKTILTRLLLLIATITFSQSQPELPAINPSDQIIRHKAYTLSYVEEHEQAAWVAYMLCRSRTNSTEERTDKFLVDPLVQTGSATNADYAKSGYDRGHLAPAADMGWSQTAMKESFYFSNMSPQVPAFNRGIWKSAETLVRRWAALYDTLYVVTGAVLKANLPTIGSSRVSIPEMYYKIVLDISPKPRVIALLIANEKGKNPLQQYVVTVDEVEKLTGIDFFPFLQDDTETVIESRKSVEKWKWE